MEKIIALIDFSDVTRRVIDFLPQNKLKYLMQNLSFYILNQRPMKSFTERLMMRREVVELKCLGLNIVI